MKAIDLILTLLGALFMVGILVSFASLIHETPKRIAACEAEGGIWTHVSSGAEFLPGGVARYVCKKP